MELLLHFKNAMYVLGVSSLSGLCFTNFFSQLWLVCDFVFQCVFALQWDLLRGKEINQFEELNSISMGLFNLLSLAIYFSLVFQRHCSLQNLIYEV